MRGVRDCVIIADIMLELILRSRAALIKTTSEVGNSKYLQSVPESKSPLNKQIVMHTEVKVYFLCASQRTEVYEACECFKIINSPSSNLTPSLSLSPSPHPLTQL